MIDFLKDCYVRLWWWLLGELRKFLLCIRWFGCKIFFYFLVIVFVKLMFGCMCVCLVLIKVFRILRGYLNIMNGFGFWGWWCVDWWFVFGYILLLEEELVVFIMCFFFWIKKKGYGEWICKLEKWLFVVRLVSY